ncbi:LysR family transcriptional regulator, partial [Staphylococcus nepalensis]|nr:LysR family transcriptional regulator [Staphylococcus nepalensis]
VTLIILLLRINIASYSRKKKMNSESLKIFCMVAEELSITRAAMRLGRVPSNITTRIQQLESDLGEPLFIRQGKQMQL